MATPNSFLPEDYLDRKIARRTNLICVGLFLVMIAAIGAAFYVQNRQDSGTRAELVEVNNAFTQRAEQLRQIKELQDRQQQMIDKAKVVRQLVERVPRSIILAEMVNNMPPALSLLEFDLQTKAAPAARTLTALDRAKAKQQKDKDKDAGKVEIVPRQVLVEIEGISKLENQITEFMGNLTHHPLFTAVGLEFIEKDAIDKTELFRFRIQMELNQSVLIERSAPEDLKRDLIQDPLAESIQINPQGDLTPAQGVANTPTQTD
ncbi:MAG: PilN domain-containing protein [Phycisphaeraceae bacterium]